MNSKNLTRMLSGAALLGGALLIGQMPAGAHGSGVVKSCIQGTDCTTNSANNAVFAVCNPVYAGTNGGACSPGRDVTIQLSNFGASKPVYVYFLNSVVDDPNATDCRQLVSVKRTALAGSPVTTNPAGKASLNAHLPPGNTPSDWSYGANWLCATTSAPGTSGGTIGDQLFPVYPA